MNFQRTFLLALSLACAAATATTAAAREPEKTAEKNLQATRAYYARLVKEQQLSQLNVLMNLLPKGGDLHHHYSGAIYGEDFIDLMEKDGYCVWAIDDEAAGARKYLVDPRFAGATPPAGCLTADLVRRNENFRRDVLMNWSSLDYGNHSHDQRPPDQHFFATFGYFDALKDRVNDSLKILKERAKAENLQYIETMLHSAPDTQQAELSRRIDALSPSASNAEIDAALAPYADFIARDGGARGRREAWLRALDEAAAGIDDADFTLRFQTFVVRVVPPARVFAKLVNAFLMAQANPKLVGVNIVAPEHNPVALRDYALHMRMFAFLKQRYPNVHIALHAGELTVGLVPPEQLKNHIRLAVEAGAERIGHGVDVTYEENPDQLFALLRKKDVPVEINLTSNAFILGVSGSMHPLPVYMANHVPVVLATDDAGVTRHTLTNEYLLLVSRYQPSYTQLKAIVANGIRYSFLTPEEKAVELRKLAARFAAFEARAAALAQGQAKK